jgi:hypothetical protein
MTSRVLLEKIEPNFLRTMEVGKVVYDKKEIEKNPFSLYKEILSLDWLKQKSYRIIRETLVKQTHTEWPGQKYSIHYYIEFDTEQDAFEFSLRYNNRMAN